MNRRAFLVSLPFLYAGRLFAAPSAPARFLLVFLRGGYDAANVLVPVSSSYYYETRPNIAVPRAEALALDADWGLHPALAQSLHPMYEKREAAFIAFAGTRGGLAACDAATIEAFAAALAGYQAKTVEQKLAALRSFLRFASAGGLVDAACLLAVPAARSARQARIPSVWDPGEVARIVEAIDRDNPCGKRDYAIILLITRLGLRGNHGRESWPRYSRHERTLHRQ